MAIRKTDAIVVRRMEYRETSLLVHLLTADYGRIHCQAKGARRSLHKFGTTFLPFSLNNVVFYEPAHHDLHIIAQADLLDPFMQFSSSLERFAAATYLLELVDTVLPVGEQNRPAYDLALHCLHSLSGRDNIIDIVHIFEVKFLSLAGFRPRLDQCAHCAAEVGGAALFSSRYGGLLCRNCSGRDAAAQSILNGTLASLKHIEQAPLLRVMQLAFAAGVREQLGRILRNFIEVHFETRFKSRQFLQKVRMTHG